MTLHAQYDPETDEIRASLGRPGERPLMSMRVRSEDLGWPAIRGVLLDWVAGAEEINMDDRCRKECGL